MTLPPRHLRLAIFLLILGACIQRPTVDETPSQGPEGEWASWRGPNRDGTVAVEGLDPSWQRGEPRQIWRRKLGEGFGSPAIAGDRVFVLFARGTEEYLAALEAQTGDEIWRHTVGETLVDRTGNGPRTTPAVADGMVYAMGTRHLVAIDADKGDEKWRVALAEPPLWGFSSSPLLLDDLLVVHAQVPGNEAPVTALHRDDGTIAWQAGQGLPGYASPLLVELHGRRQILAFIGGGLLALEPQSGRLLWSHPWRTSYGVNAADPVFYPPDKIFISSGYDTGAALLEVRTTGSGYETSELWSTRSMKNHFSSSVRVGDHLYGFDNASLKAIDLTDGSTQWRQRGFGKGSLLLAGDRLLVLGDEGSLALVEPSPERYLEHGRIQALDTGSWSPPALAGRWLYLRDHQEIVCLDLAER